MFVKPSVNCRPGCREDERVKNNGNVFKGRPKSCRAENKNGGGVPNSGTQKEGGDSEKETSHMSSLPDSRPSCQNMPWPALSGKQRTLRWVFEKAETCRETQGVPWFLIKASIPGCRKESDLPAGLERCSDRAWVQQHHREHQRAMLTFVCKWMFRKMDIKLICLAGSKSLAWDDPMVMMQSWNVDEVRCVSTRLKTTGLKFEELASGKGECRRLREQMGNKRAFCLGAENNAPTFIVWPNLSLENWTGYFGTFFKKIRQKWFL